MKLISIIIPLYNEEKNIAPLFQELETVCDSFKERYECEFIFVNDGSVDSSAQEIKKFEETRKDIFCVEFSRNFGKEAAISAGLKNARGDAAIIIDADLQHPPRLIPQFIQMWEQGAEVVVGVKKNKHESFFKRTCSSLFYIMINKISDSEITPSATDYRLLDRIVIDEFNKLTEKNRMARGLIDWLGFRREYIYFEIDERRSGRPAYSFPKLVRLAFSSIVSLSLFPLRLAGYLGIFITCVSSALGLFILIEKYFLNDPLKMRFSGSVILAVVTMFLVGIVLICLGLIALYIANIHREVINRPMYIARKKREKDFTL